MSATTTADEKDDRQASKARMKDCCKKVLKFLFSHIGLCGMVVAYSVAGGFIFEHLEKLNEKTECLKAQEKYGPVENKTKNTLWEIASRNSANDVVYIMGEFEKVLQKYRKNVLELGYDGKNCKLMGETGGPGYQWNFPGALLFSVTVITTIGECMWNMCFILEKLLKNVDFLL